MRKRQVRASVVAAQPLEGSNALAVLAAAASNKKGNDEIRGANFLDRSKPAFAERRYVITGESPSFEPFPHFISLL